LKIVGALLGLILAETKSDCGTDIRIFGGTGVMPPEPIAGK
jgi:hypothetical protein